MYTDILFIITTAFALFGVYCFAEVISNWIASCKFPPSVTIMDNRSDAEVYRKIKYIEENLPNNHIVLYPIDNRDNTENNISFEEYLKDVLYVNNK